jgi:transposase
LHRIRERLIKNKVAVSNQMRGLLSEFGVVFPCGHAAPIIGLKNVIGSTQYSARLKNTMKGMLNEYNTIVKRVKGIETQLLAFVDNSQSGQILRGIPGIGIINASAFLAAIDNV